MLWFITVKLLFGVNCCLCSSSASWGHMSFYVHVCPCPRAWVSVPVHECWCGVGCACMRGALPESPVSFWDWVMFSHVDCFLTLLLSELHVWRFGFWSHWGNSLNLFGPQFLHIPITFLHMQNKDVLLVIGSAIHKSVKEVRTSLWLERKQYSSCVFFEDYLDRGLRSSKVE